MSDYDAERVELIPPSVTLEIPTAYDPVDGALIRVLGTEDIGWVSVGGVLIPAEADGFRFQHTGALLPRWVVRTQYLWPGFSASSSAMTAGLLLSDVAVDGGVPDGGVPDGGVPDGGVPDGGNPDGGPADGGVIDAGTCVGGMPCTTGNTCEVGETTCVGEQLVCVGVGVRSAGTLCRAAAGDCDVAEFCDGQNATCPADAFAAGTLCRDAAGDCDVAEFCDGQNAACPADAFAAGTRCRDAAGDCDVEEFCDGQNAACPADAFAAGTRCRDPAGDCDVAEFCDGQNAACPADAFAASTEICREARGKCDPEELCTGQGPQCPSDEIHDSSVLCRDSSSTCDVAEYCDGVGDDCPADGFSPVGSPCPDGVCDVLGQCVAPGPQTLELRWAPDVPGLRTLEVSEFPELSCWSACPVTPCNQTCTGQYEYDAPLIVVGASVLDPVNIAYEKEAACEFRIQESMTLHVESDGTYVWPPVCDRLHTFAQSTANWGERKVGWQFTSATSEERTYKVIIPPKIPESTNSEYLYVAINGVATELIEQTSEVDVLEQRFSLFVEPGDRVLFVSKIAARVGEPKSMFVNSENDGRTIEHIHYQRLSSP